MNSSVYVTNSPRDQRLTSSDIMAASSLHMVPSFLSVGVVVQMMHLVRESRD